MVSKLFSTAGSFISQVGEVLAPAVHSPLEDLRDHWKAIRKFYIDENETDVEAFQSSQLPEHLVTMVSILVDEEAILGDTGPCVEFFLQNKIVETLCLLAERDTKHPQGVRKLVLQTVNILLGDVALPLLPRDMSVHRPVRNLIRRMILLPQHPPARSSPPSQTTTTTQTTPTKDPPPPPPDSEFVTLLETLTSKLMRDPSLIGFFVDDIHFEEGDLLVFQGLLKHLWDSGAIGERARRGTANCLLLPLSSLPSSSLPSKIPAYSDEPPPPPPPADQQPVSSASTPSQDSTTSPASTPSPVPTTSPEPTKHYTINWQVFVKRQVSELVTAFRKLPVLTSLPASSPPHDQLLLENCKARFLFCSSLAKLPNTEISGLLLTVFEEQFLDGSLGPALLHPSEAEGISALIYIRELLPCAQPPLLDVILKFLLGDFVGPELKEEADVHLLRYTLISKINSTNDLMSIAACRFFSSLIGLHSHQVLNNLVLRTLLPSSSSSPSPFKRTASPNPPNRTQKREDATLESLQPSITRFLTLFGTKFAQITPSQSHTASTSTSTSSSRVASPIPFPAVSSDDHSLSSSPSDHISDPSSDSPNTDSSNPTQTHRSNLIVTSTGSSSTTNLHNLTGSTGISGASEIVGGGVGYDSYLVDAQHQVTIFKAACKEWPMATLVPTQTIQFVGLFLEQVLAKLGRSLDQELDVNLVLTGLLAKLCYCPVIALTMYLLCYQPNVTPGVPTLYGTLEKLLQEIEARSKSFINIGSCIERARNEMADPNPNYDHSYNKLPNIDLDFSPKRFLQAVIVLEEFCKELAAVLQAKVVFGLGAEKKGPLRNAQ